jgi:hypothetical protein
LKILKSKNKRNGNARLTLAKHIGAQESVHALHDGVHHRRAWAGEVKGISLLAKDISLIEEIEISQVLIRNLG